MSNQIFKLDLAMVENIFTNQFRNKAGNYYKVKGIDMANNPVEFLSFKWDFISNLQEGQPGTVFIQVEQGSDGQWRWKATNNPSAQVSAPPPTSPAPAPAPAPAPQQYTIGPPPVGPSTPPSGPPPSGPPPIQAPPATRPSGPPPVNRGGGRSRSPEETASIQMQTCLKAAAEVAAPVLATVKAKTSEEAVDMTISIASGLWECLKQGLRKPNTAEEDSGMTNEEFLPEAAYADGPKRS